MGGGPLPGSAAFVGNPDGTGDLNWLASYADAGVHNVTFYAYDALDSALVDSEIVTITVTEAGNQTPVMTAINDTTVVEGGSLIINVTATDPDTEIPSLSATGLPANATVYVQSRSHSIRPVFRRLQGGRFIVGR